MSRRSWLRFPMLVRLAVLALALGGAAMLWLSSSDDAVAATGPCNPASRDITGQEQELLNLANAWRAQNLGAPPMTISMTASAAAQWFAEAMIAGEYGYGGDGHKDKYGRSWAERLKDCGYPGSFGSGEALAGFGSSDPSFGSTPAQALADMVSNPNHQNAANAPVAWKCAGLGFAVSNSPSPGNLRYAWVLIGVQTFSECAQAVSGSTSTPPTATPTSPATPSASPTATRTATPTATPTRTPSNRRAYAVAVARDVDTPTPYPDTPTPPPGTPTPLPPGATATPTASPTHAATATPTTPASPTATSTPSVCGGTFATIVSVDKLAERVVLNGQGEMTGWVIVSERRLVADTPQVFQFPDGYRLDGAVTVRSGVEQFAPMSTEVWWTLAPMWDNTQKDDALLYDCRGVLVQRFED